MEELATKRQLYALWLITHQDWRGKGLTKQQASDMIREASRKSIRKAEAESDVKQIISEAIEAGLKAARDARPKPMVVVTHQNMADDSSPIERAEFVSEGPCGFASVHISYSTPENRRFINAGKKLGLIAGRDGKPENAVFHKADRGFMHWVSAGGQSLARKEAYADAFAKVLVDKARLKVTVRSRLD